MTSGQPRRLRRWIAGTLIGLLLLGAIGVAALRIAIARMPEYQAQLQSIVKERTGLLIEFERLDARLRLYGPEVIFHRAVLRAPDGRVLASARRGAVSLALGRSLINWRLLPGRVTLDGPEIGIVRTAEGEFRIIGYQPLEEDEEPFELSRIPEGHMRIRDARLRFLDEQREREPWVLSRVELVLNRDGENFHVDGSSALPAELGQALSFEVDMRGDLANRDELKLRVALDGDSLQLARWRQVFGPELVRELGGVASIELESRWQGRHLADLTARFDARELMVTVPTWTLPIPAADPLRFKTNEAQSLPQPAQDPPTAQPLAGKALPDQVSYEQLAARIDLKQVRGEWRLEVNDLELRQPDVAIGPARLRAGWQRTSDRLVRFEAQAEVIPLQSIWPLLAWLPERESLARFRALEGRGLISDAKLSWHAPQAETPARYNFEAKAQGVGFAPVARAPGIDDVDLVLAGDERGGTLKLNRTALRLSWPRVFREDPGLDALTGEVQWTRVPEGWQISSDRLDLSNPHGRARLAGSLLLPSDGSSPVADLHAEASDLDTRATPRYVPAGNLSEKTVEWLDRAFVAGRVPQATLVLKGELRRFPFRDGGGDFIARGALEDLTVDYQPEWLPATNVHGVVEFRNQSMRGELQAGRVGGLVIERATATFEDFRQTVLTIRAHGRGDVYHGLRYLQTSPLGESMGRGFQGLTGRGSSVFDVNLSLPLKNLPARHVEVVAKLDNAWIDHDLVTAPVSRLRGELKVENSQVRSANLQGHWLGGPVKVQVQPGSAVPLLDVSGSARAVEIARLLRLPPSVRLTGQSAWRAQAHLTDAPGDQSLATLTLDLNDTSVHLPAPLNKTSDETRPLVAEVQLLKRAALVRTTYGEVRSIARIARGEEGWQFDRAGLRADGHSPSLPSHAGVRVEGTIDRFILDDWLALASPEAPSRQAGESRNRLPDVLRAANVEVKEFGYLGYRWSDLRGVLQAERDHWRIDVNSAHASGRMRVPYVLAGVEPLTLELDKLVIPGRAPGVSEAGSDDEPARDPRSLPGVRARVTDFAVESHRIGELTLALSRVPAGIRIDTLQVRSPTFEGQVSGSWLMTPAGELTSLDVALLSSDVRETLNRLDYRPFMQAARAEIKGKLAWPGGLSAKWLAQASGHLTVSADEGTLLSLEPGAGRVLGLFSFSALPRRLSLDFSDVTQEGLSFDTIRGDFELRDGNAYTSNLVVSGPATEIGLAGRTGLEARDYDQTVVVTGKLGASLPVAGALAGGPAVAAAVLLFSQIFKEPLKGITRGYYRITGSWDDPVVERVQGQQARQELASPQEETTAARESSE